MEEYLIHKDDYGVVICRQHHYAIPPNWISRHFQENHQAIPLQRRKEIEECVALLNLLPPSQIQLPSDTIPINGLSVHNGLKCLYEGCNELKGTTESMRKHCQRAHKWIKSVGVMWTEQTVQTFFVGSHLKYVFFNCF